MEDWESKLCQKTEIKDVEIDGEKITIKPISWYQDEQLQSKHFKFNQKTSKMDVDTAEYASTILKLGVIKGPWPAELKEAVLMKLKKSVKEQLVEAITGGKVPSSGDELKKK